MDGAKRIFSLIFVISILIGPGLACAVTEATKAEAEEKVGVTDKIIISTFKSLAKGFLAMADLNKIKKVNIEKIKKMDDEKFRKQLYKAYRVMKDLPVEMRTEYGISETMSKEQAIKDIESLDKKKLYKILDTVPEKLVAKHYRRYIRKSGQEMQSNVAAQIKGLWDKWMQKAQGKSK